jgi:hypothetical protein
MVLAHQVEGHNRIARAALQTREALCQEAELRRELNERAGARWPSTDRRIKSAGEPLVEYLLMGGEAGLTDRVEGTSGFATMVARRGPFDRRGRSLREFDLTTRLFKYPCSYLVYTEAFDALPGGVRNYVLRRVWEVLTGKDRSAAFAHLTAADRTMVLDILRYTKHGLPDYWRE